MGKKAKEIKESTRNEEGKRIRQPKNCQEMVNNASGQARLHTDLAITSNNSQLLTKRTKVIDSNSGSVVVKSCSPTNWFHLHIWPAIDLAGRQIEYSPREMVRLVQSRFQNTGFYDNLQPSTAQYWIDTSSLK